MNFSIVTPSFRNSSWLKLCIASVADQQGVELEHIVQDACSDDETQDWLPHDGRVRAFIEKDTGMYDAINRGYGRARGDLLAHLNSDEQYLPGTLKAVHDFFAQHPDVEVILADTIVVDGNCNYMCHRHALIPDYCHIWFSLSALTASIFLRRRVIQDRGLLFDTRWRALADLHWVKALLDNKVPMVVMRRLTSTFANTSENLSWKPVARREAAETLAMSPWWVRMLQPIWLAYYRLRRVSAGHFWLKPTSYSIYTPESPGQRVRFEVLKPTGIWKKHS